jgi:hypothetical protein
VISDNIPASANILAPNLQHRRAGIAVKHCSPKTSVFAAPAHELQCSALALVDRCSHLPGHKGPLWETWGLEITLGDEVKTLTEVDAHHGNRCYIGFRAAPGASAVSPRLEPKLNWRMYGFLIDPRSAPTNTSTTGKRARGSSTNLTLASPPPLGFSIAGVGAAYLVMMLILQPAKIGYQDLRKMQ